MHCSSNNFTPDLPPSITQSFVWLILPLKLSALPNSQSQTHRLVSYTVVGWLSEIRISALKFSAYVDRAVGAVMFTVTCPPEMVATGHPSAYSSLCSVDAEDIDRVGEEEVSLVLLEVAGLLLVVVKCRLKIFTAE